MAQFSCYSWVDIPHEFTCLMKTNHKRSSFLIVNELKSEASTKLYIPVNKQKTTNSRKLSPTNLIKWFHSKHIDFGPTKTFECRQQIHVAHLKGHLAQTRFLWKFILGSCNCIEMYDNGIISAEGIQITGSTSQTGPLLFFQWLADRFEPDSSALD